MDSRIIRLQGRRIRPKTNGFTLVEVIIAVGVIAVGLLALVSVFIAGHRANTYGANLSAATNRARQILEVVRSEGLAYKDTIPPGNATGFNDGNTKVPLNSSPPSQLAAIFDADEDKDQALGIDRFRRNIVTTRASTDPGNYLYDLLIMKVTVYWHERGVEKSVTVTSLLKRAGS